MTSDTRRRDADRAAREAAVEAEAALLSLRAEPSPETLSRAEAAEAAAEAAAMSAAEAYVTEGRGPVCDGDYEARWCDARASVITVYDSGEAVYQCDDHMTPGPHADTRYLSRAAEAAFNAYMALSEVSGGLTAEINARAAAEALTARVRAAAEREAERAPADTAAAVYDAVTRALTEELS